MKKVENKIGYLAISKEDERSYFEQFKGEVINKDIKFPKDLGIEHPFEFEDAEKVFKTVGIISGCINKISENILGEFQVKTENKKVKIIINNFIKDNDFQSVLKEWITEALVKGNGFLEIDAKEQKIRVLNANNMYVVRDKKGKIKGYNQFIGKDLSRFNLNSTNVTSFLPNEIAHLMINKLAGDAYGQGLIMPNERVIENIVLNEQDLVKLISRKAGAPMHVQVGQPGEVTDPGAVDNIKNLLVYMTNRTEWVTDANVNMKVVDFGEIGKNLTDTILHNIRMLCAGMQIPEVMLNSGQLNEGIAKVQLEGFQRMIASIQEEIESLVEEKIFKPLLISNSQVDDFEFVWNLPGEEEINTRLTQLNTTLQNPFLSDGMRREIQIEIGRLLHFENPETLVDTPNSQGMTADKQPTFTPDGKEYKPGQSDVEKKKNENERQKEENIKQPELPGEKKMCCEVPIREKLTEEDYNEMPIKEFVNLVEANNLNYSDYLLNILKRVKIDEFQELSAITEKDVENGLLTEEQVNRLRLIMKNAFRKNQTMRQISTEIKDNLSLKDRITENGATIPANSRPDMISRTETIRLANLGLIDTYKQNNVNKVRWLAALSDRTCEQCESMNGQVFEINEAPMPTVDTHPMCRCSLLSIT